jgi:putative transposase
MPKKGHTEEQILAGYIRWRRAEKSPMSARRRSILWRKKYSGLGLNELRELRQLSEENSKLMRLVADLSLDRHMLQEPISKKL